MKITSEQEIDKGPVVAYSRCQGGDVWLTINDLTDGPVCLSHLGVGKRPDWNPTDPDIYQKFYKGDKVTIEF